MRSKMEKRPWEGDFDKSFRRRLNPILGNMQIKIFAVWEETKIACNRWQLLKTEAEQNVMNIISDLSVHDLNLQPSQDDEIVDSKNQCILFDTYVLEKGIDPLSQGKVTKDLLQKISSAELNPKHDLISDISDLCQNHRRVYRVITMQKIMTLLCLTVINWYFWKAS